jgi:hypothetical protein
MLVACMMRVIGVNSVRHIWMRLEAVQPVVDTMSYSGIVTRVFTWFLIIYFTILIITESNIIKLDRRNNEGRKNK